MVMDMGTECRVARAQLSDDPDDWVWVRLYEARPDAKVMPGLHWGCNPLWDVARTTSYVGPQIFLHPSKHRPWRLSPFAGQDFLGEPSWFADGLPKDVRKPGETGPGCEAEIWESAAGVGLGADLGEPVARGDGGSAEGGEWAPGVGALARGEGGSAEGGTAATSFASPISMEGGSAEGGEAGTGYGAVAVSEGGSAEGGEAGLTAAYYSTAEGGSAEGGESITGYGAAAVMEGGSAEGGESQGTTAYAAVMEGGAAEGGEPAHSGGRLYVMEGGSVEGGEPVGAVLLGAVMGGGSAEGGEPAVGFGATETMDGGCVEGAESGAWLEEEDVLTGAVLAWAKDGAVPLGYLKCDGAAVSRTTYANLYDVIGTTFGSGDGSTTFNVPDLRGRFVTMPGGPINQPSFAFAGGAAERTIGLNNLPPHTHSVAGKTRIAAVTGNAAGYELGDPSQGNTAVETAGAGGGEAFNLRPPYLTLQYVIKT